MKPARKIGRPTKFDPVMCEQARKLCLLGATNEDLANFFKVTVSTIDKWIKDEPSFSGAVKGAKEELDGMVVRRLFERATGYSHPDTHISNYQGQITETPITKHYPPDATSAIFWLKNRRPKEWRDRIEHTGKDGADLVPLNDESRVIEVARGIAFLLFKGAELADKKGRTIEGDKG